MTLKFRCNNLIFVEFGVKINLLRQVACVGTSAGDLLETWSPSSKNLHRAHDAFKLLRCETFHLLSLVCG